MIYDRQKEVTIGKRNVNCLSCAKEPKSDNNIGKDGRIYRGVNKDLSPEKTKQQ